MSENWPTIDGVDIDDVKDRLGDDVDLFYELMEQLVNDPIIDDISTADASLDVSAWAVRLHQLKGAAGMLGATTVYRAAANAEQSAKSNIPPADLLPQLTEVQAALLSLRTQLSTPTPTSPDSATTDSSHLNPAIFAPLLSALHANDLAAVDMAQQRALDLQTILGGEYAIFFQRIGTLDFPAAYDQLDAVLTAQTNVADDDTAL